MIRVAESESPPKSKKSSWIPTSSVERTSAQIFASSFSMGVLGATYGVVSSGLEVPGSGSAFRSTFRVSVSGMASSVTSYEGSYSREAFRLRIFSARRLLVQAVR